MASIQINEIPSDVMKFILKVQGEIKERKGVGKYSQAATVVQIVKDQMELRESKSKAK